MNSELKVGDILVSTWGYEQTNVDFYQIIKTTAKTVTVRKIERHGFEHGSSMTGVVKPLKDKFTGSPIRRKIKQYNGSFFIDINSYSIADLWDGKPQNVTSYA